MRAGSGCFLLTWPGCSPPQATRAPTPPTPDPSVLHLARMDVSDAGLGASDGPRLRAPGRLAARTAAWRRTPTAWFLRTLVRLGAQPTPPALAWGERQDSARTLRDNLAISPSQSPSATARARKRCSQWPQAPAQAAQPREACWVLPADQAAQPAPGRTIEAVDRAHQAGSHSNGDGAVAGQG